ncbi:SGNH/GDSL hydrolase family protein [Mesonia maritima]|uniref:Lysophospholipase L1-like esterase n=1 Tax=Mesonia maritima TaxID=1793873 RepID=A0ABU1K6F2_9FLAO|nr:SGNH/GDSL hydrolase family protein [Mesonia maritima]MDR6301188.1 lysophospholipase L1-like esterase [Mesonia maritima]
MKNWLLLAFAIIFFSSCGSISEISENKKSLSYLALGDSYTIGERVAEEKRWPIQLAEALREDGFSIQSPKIIAKTGWRTDELLSAMNKELSNEKYDLVSVLIGVNNQYQGKSIETYQEELERILEEAITHSKFGKEGVFVLSIPDYGVTPFGLKSDKQNISKEVAEFNKVCKATCRDFGIPFYNITDISLEAETDSTLVADDGLHPSGEMYKRWVTKILPQVKALIKN